MPADVELLQYDAFLLPGRLLELDETLIGCLLGLNKAAAAEHVENDQAGIHKYLRKCFPPLASILRRMIRRLEDDSLQNALQSAWKICHSTEENLENFFYPQSFNNSELQSYSNTILNLDEARENLNPEVPGENKELESLYVKNKKNARQRARILTLELRNSLIKVEQELPEELRVFLDLATLFHDLKPPAPSDRRSRGSSIGRFCKYFREEAKPKLSKQLSACRQFCPDFYSAVNSQLKRFKCENYADSMTKLRSIAASTLRDRTKSPTPSEDPPPAGDSPDSTGKSSTPNVPEVAVSITSKRKCLLLNGTKLDFLGIAFGDSTDEGAVLKLLVQEIADVNISRLNSCSCIIKQKEACHCKVPKLKTPAEFVAVLNKSADGSGLFKHSFRGCLSRITAKLRKGLATERRDLIENIKEFEGREKWSSGAYRLNLDAILSVLKSRTSKLPVESAKRDSESGSDTPSVE